MLLVLGGLGPMLAAILVSSYESGGAGARALFGQLLRWRVSLKWYLIALLGIAALELSVVPVRLASGGSVDGESLLGALGVAPFHFLFVALIGGGLDEEMGWRGYALLQLQGPLSSLTANLLLGVMRVQLPPFKPSPALRWAGARRRHCVHETRTEGSEARHILEHADQPL